MIEELTIEVWCVNLGRTYRNSEEFTREVEKLLREVNADLAIILFQEIDEADRANEHTILYRLTNESFSRAAWNTAVPILVSKKRAEIKRRRVKFAAPGLAGFTPNRHIAEVVVKFTSKHGAILIGWPRTAFLGTHVPINRKVTQSRRRAVRVALRARVWFHKVRKHIVVYALDSNTPKGEFPRMVKGEVLLRQRGIDLIVAVLPPGFEIARNIPLTVNLGIDSHDGIGARVTLRKVTS